MRKLLRTTARGTLLALAVLFGSVYLALQMWFVRRKAFAAIARRRGFFEHCALAPIGIAAAELGKAADFGDCVAFDFIPEIALDVAADRRTRIHAAVSFLSGGAPHMTQDRGGIEADRGGAGHAMGRRPRVEI